MTVIPLVPRSTGLCRKTWWVAQILHLRSNYCEFSCLRRAPFIAHIVTLGFRDSSLSSRSPPSCLLTFASLIHPSVSLGPPGRLLSPWRFSFLTLPQMSLSSTWYPVLPWEHQVGGDPATCLNCIAGCPALVDLSPSISHNLVGITVDGSRSFLTPSGTPWPLIFYAPLFENKVI